MTYKSLTLENRKMIEEMLRRNMKKPEIAEALNVNESTIYREILRGKTDEGIYSAELGHSNSRKGKAKASDGNPSAYFVKSTTTKRHIDFEERLIIESLFNNGRTPLEIAIALGRHSQAIYRELRSGKQKDGSYSAELAQINKKR